MEGTCAKRLSEDLVANGLAEGGEGCALGEGEYCGGVGWGNGNECIGGVAEGEEGEDWMGVRSREGRIQGIVPGSWWRPWRKSVIDG